MKNSVNGYHRSPLMGWHRDFHDFLPRNLPKNLLPLSPPKLPTHSNCINTLLLFCCSPLTFIYSSHSPSALLGTLWVSSVNSALGKYNFLIRIFPLGISSFFTRFLSFYVIRIPFRDLWGHCQAHPRVSFKVASISLGSKKFGIGREGATLSTFGFISPFTCVCVCVCVCVYLLKHR